MSSISVSQAKQSATSGTSSQTLVLTSAPVENDLLILFVDATGGVSLPTSGVTVSDPNGTWSVLVAANYAENVTGTRYMTAYYRVVGPGETWVGGTTAITVNFGTNTTTNLTVFDYTGWVGKPEVDPNWSTYSGGGYQVSLCPSGTGATKTFLPAPVQFTSGALGYLMVGMISATSIMGNGTATPTVAVNGATALTPSSLGAVPMAYGYDNAWILYVAGMNVSNNGSGNSVVWVQSTGRYSAGWAISFLDTGVYADSGSATLTLTGGATASVPLAPAGSVTITATATETYSETLPATLSLTGGATASAGVGASGGLTLTAGATDTFSATSTPASLTLAAGATDTSTNDDNPVTPTIALTGSVADSYFTAASLTLAAGATDTPVPLAAASLALTTSVSDTLSNAVALAALSLTGSVAVLITGAASLAIQAAAADNGFDEHAVAALTLSSIDLVTPGVTGTTTTIALAGAVIDEAAAAAITLSAGPISVLTTAPNPPADPLLGADGLLILQNLWNAAKTGYHYSGAQPSGIDIWVGSNPFAPEWEQYQLTTGKSPAIVGLNNDYCVSNQTAGAYAGFPVAGWNQWGVPLASWSQILAGLIDIINDSGTIMLGTAICNPANYFLGNAQVNGATTVAAVNASGVLPVVSASTGGFSAYGGTGVVRCNDSGLDGVTTRLHYFTYGGLSGNNLQEVTIYGYQGASIANHAFCTVSWLNGQTTTLPNVSEALPLQFSATAYQGLATIYGSTLGSSTSYATAESWHANGNLNSALDDILRLATSLNDQSGITLILRLFAESNGGSQWAGQAWFGVLWRYCVAYMTGSNPIYDGSGNSQPIASTPIASIVGNGTTVTVTLTANSPLATGQATTISGIPAGNAFASLNGTTVSSVTKTSLPGQPTVFTFANATTGTYTPGQFDTPAATTPAHNLLFNLILSGSIDPISGAVYPPSNLVDLMGIDCYNTAPTSHLTDARTAMAGQPGTYNNIPWGLTEWYGTPTSSPGPVAFLTAAPSGLTSGQTITGQMWGYFGEGIGGATGNAQSFPLTGGTLAVATDQGLEFVTYSSATVTAGTQPGGVSAPATVVFTLSSSASGNPLTNGTITWQDSGVVSMSSMLTAIKASTATTLPYAAYFTFYDNSYGFGQPFQAGSRAALTTFMTDASIKNLGDGLSGYRDQGQANLTLGGSVGHTEFATTQTTTIQLAAAATEVLPAAPVGLLTLSGIDGPVIAETAGGALVTLTGGPDTASAVGAPQGLLFLSFTTDVAAAGVTTQTTVVQLTGFGGSVTLSDASTATVNLSGEVFTGEVASAILNLAGTDPPIAGVTASAGVQLTGGSITIGVAATGSGNVALQAGVTEQVVTTAGATVTLAGLLFTGYQATALINLTAASGAGALTTIQPVAVLQAVRRTYLLTANPPDNGGNMPAAVTQTWPTTFYMGAAEEQTFGIDLAPDLDTGESISSLSVAMTSVDDNSVVGLSIDPVLAGTTLLVTIDGGVDPIEADVSYRYRVTFVATPSTNRFTVDALVQVSP